MVIPAVPAFFRKLFYGLIILTLFSCNSNSQNNGGNFVPPPPSLPVYSVSSETDTTFQVYPATLEGITNVEIRPQVNGTLEKLFIDEGAYVHKGQDLFKINDRPFLAQLRNAEASLHAAEGTQVNANLEIEKISPLVQNKVVSEFQLKTANAALQIAKSNVELARANVSSAQINLGYTLIKAPTNGYISRLNKKQGSLVSNADPQPLTVLSDVHTIRAYFTLSEQDFINFKKQYPGNTLADKLHHLPPVSLLLSDNTEYPLPGKIDMVDGQFDKNTGAITFRANFENPNGLLRSGNTGKIRLSLKHENSTKVPQSATLELQDKVYVFLLADSNKVHKRTITVEGKSGDYYLIKDGVKVGDQIVLSGFDRLQDGQAIVPVKGNNTVVKK